MDRRQSPRPGELKHGRPMQLTGRAYMSKPTVSLQMRGPSVPASATPYKVTRTKRLLLATTPATPVVGAGSTSTRPALPVSKPFPQSQIARTERRASRPRLALSIPRIARASMRSPTVSLQMQESSARGSATPSKATFTSPPRTRQRATKAAVRSTIMSTPPYRWEPRRRLLLGLQYKTAHTVCPGSPPRPDRSIPRTHRAYTFRHGYGERRPYLLGVSPARLSAERYQPYWQGWRWSRMHTGCCRQCQTHGVSDHDFE